jgi:8-oxo-dGTP pyrophosphatase MutT (NUDIX family)
MTIQDRPWEILEKSQVLDTPYLKIRSERIGLPDGTILPNYFIIENRGWVGVVPVTEDGRFLLNRQYKHGIGKEVLEFPAGGIDEHEDDPMEAAHRELMEESGYSAAPDKIELLSEQIANPTSAVTRVWWYLARDVCKTGNQKIDPAEVIENLLVTPAELLDLIHQGEFAVQGQIAAAYLALEKLRYFTIRL